jgi:hypothetical protein
MQQLDRVDKLFLPKLFELNYIADEECEKQQLKFAVDHHTSKRGISVA